MALVLRTMMALSLVDATNCVGSLHDSPPAMASHSSTVSGSGLSVFWNQNLEARGVHRAGVSTKDRLEQSHTARSTNAVHLSPSRRRANWSASTALKNGPTRLPVAWASAMPATQGSAWSGDLYT